MVLLMPVLAAAEWLLVKLLRGYCDLSHVVGVGVGVGVGVVIVVVVAA